MIAMARFGNNYIRKLKMKILLSVFLFAICLLLISWKPVASNAYPVKGPKGKKTYDKVCSPCHSADAKGIPSFSPALSGSKIVLGPGNKLIRVLLKGSAEFKNYPGHNSKNEMPAQADLKDRRIANLLTYIRSNFGNKAPAITADEVKLERAKL
jgi:mono/diheme cytochrome c family protein